MKSNCEECQCRLTPDSEAHACLNGCTFCAQCSGKWQAICPHCGGGLAPQPLRLASAEFVDSDLDIPHMRTWLIWAISFGVWTVMAFAGAFTMYQFNLLRGWPRDFSNMLWLELSQSLTYAPLTPFVFLLSCRYPLRRSEWRGRLALYCLGALLFTVAHVGMRGLTYQVWDVGAAGYVSAIWNAQAHVIRIRWDLFQSLFFFNVVDDITGTYLPIVLIAHVVAYYQRLRQRELRTSQLQTQLAKARLHALKSQLQPHFLFNTMHSISALMLTDVRAADRMMTRLSDLLRISLEAEGTQITTVSRELESVNCYLEIEKIRFEERLNVVFDIAPETLDAQVPHLLLQPLVDNAVKHGISKLHSGGEVRIIVKRVAGELQLHISDNGPGFGEPDLLHPNGLGLRVTRERLESLYGQNHSMELLSPPQGGASVRVSIPFRGVSREEQVTYEVQDFASNQMEDVSEPSAASSIASNRG